MGTYYVLGRHYVRLRDTAEQYGNGLCPHRVYMKEMETHEKDELTGIKKIAIVLTSEKEVRALT